jgi:hypothetical protein
VGPTHLVVGGPLLKRTGAIYGQTEHATTGRGMPSHALWGSRWLSHTRQEVPPRFVHPAHETG